MVALILFFKSHVKGYTRKDGAYVKDHENNRQKKAGGDNQNILVKTKVEALYNPSLEMNPIELVDDLNMPIDGDAKALSKYLRQKHGNVQVENKQTGNKIGFYREGIEASVKNRKILARRLYAILPQLLREAAYAGYEENTKLDKKPHVLGYETYYAAVLIDGKVHSARIAVDRIKNNVRGRGYYYHQVEEVTLGNEVGSTRVLSDSKSQVSTPLSPNAIVTLGQLIEKVNDNSSKVQLKKSLFFGNTTEILELMKRL